MKMRSDMYFPVDIEKVIQGLSLSSPECTPAFLSKDFTAYTLEALSVLKVTEEMKREMSITVEHDRRRADGRRNAEFDVLVQFKESMIDVEIQRRRKGDEIDRSTFYMARMATELKKGLERIPHRRLISVWICEFNPFEHLGMDLPYYAFESRYIKTEGIEGTEKAFPMGNGVRYVFINGAFDWEGLERRRALTAEERTLKTYVMDMRQVSVDNIVNEITRKTLADCKEEGSMSYDKIYEELYERHKDFYDNVAAKSKAEGLSEGVAQEKTAMVKSLFSQGVSLDVISSASGLTKEDILSICK